jgi:hypothetical protein
MRVVGDRRDTAHVQQYALLSIQILLVYSLALELGISTILVT